MNRPRAFHLHRIALPAAALLLSGGAASAQTGLLGVTAPLAPGVQIAQRGFRNRFSDDRSGWRRRRKRGNMRFRKRQMRGNDDDGPRQAARSPFFKRASFQQKKRAGLVSTGLRIVQPNGARCPDVASPFGSRTRYDGSYRASWANYGYHGGMDISLREGTPIFAIASGTVLDVRTGGRLVGNQIMIKHSPRDTGTRYWMVSKYKHFRDRPRLRPGQRVRVGQVIGYSGNTGTTGGHFGFRGYYHLHMSVYITRTNVMRVTQRGGLYMPKGKYLDPIGLFRHGPYDNHRLRALPRSRKRVRIPYKTSPRGPVMPRRSRLVWPVACKRS